ncbi:hypothetical protein L1D46_05355 [Pseudoalteromonas sp. Isolate3]|uniref:hypothetical protein n=1 Tax=Pseudoalteromonas sp. Isolate3 TaxID=2908526 RepID=UPI001EFC41E8|nr:hypothetical protein [Pseudoalteromonas sp. Isolate3]MCG9708227.1 hypothetical protein [Pseudoalteromonas sp. Isolate3]
MCELLEKAILTVKKVWRAIIDKLVKKSVIAVLSVTVVHLVIAAVICNWVYDHYVITGNIGSVSDILIASFTGLISLATTLLLVLAWMTKESWLEQIKKQRELNFLDNFIEYYYECWFHADCKYDLDIYDELVSQKAGDLKSDLSSHANRFMSKYLDISCKVDSFSIKEVRHIKKCYELNYRESQRKYSKHLEKMNTLRLELMKHGPVLSLDFKTLMVDIGNVSKDLNPDTVIESYAEKLGVENFKPMNLGPFPKAIDKNKKQD